MAWRECLVRVFAVRHTQGQQLVLASPRPASETQNITPHTRNVGKVTGVMSSRTNKRTHTCKTQICDVHMAVAIIEGRNEGREKGRKEARRKDSTAQVRQALHENERANMSMYASCRSELAQVHPEARQVLQQWRMHVQLQHWLKCRRSVARELSTPAIFNE
jgi:hypothetical protein